MPAEEIPAEDNDVAVFVLSIEVTALFGGAAMGVGLLDYHQSPTILGSHYPSLSDNPIALVDGWARVSVRALLTRLRPRLLPRTDSRLFSGLLSWWIYWLLSWLNSR